MSKRVQRWDTHGTLAPAQRLPNGWLRVEGRTARVGLLQYTGDDGKIINELVLPEDLFAEESMASARMVPVTNGHPDGQLDARTAKAHQVGSVGENLRRDGDYLVAPMMITDAAAVRAIDDGRQELSWGYECEVDPPDPKLVATWGEHHGIQRHRTYNHLATVDAARAGSQARVRLDASGNAHLDLADASGGVVPLIAPQQEPREPTPMPQTIKFDGRTFQADDANAAGIQQAIEEVIARVKADAARELGVEKQRADTATSTLAKVRSAVTSNWSRIKAKFDAMKARAMPCDECGGSGKVMDAKCDYCDGAGSIRMHDAIKEEPVAAEMEQDAGGLMAEQDPGTPADVAAAEHRDSADKVVKSINAAMKRRRDSIARQVKRDTTARVALETTARKFLGADAKLDGKSTEEIHRLVIGKAKPSMKLDGKDAGFVAVAFEMAVADGAAAAGGDRNDGGAGGAGGNGNNDERPAPRADEAAWFDVKAAQKKYDENLKAACKRPGAAARA